MNGFVFCSPTKVIFGKGTAVKVGEEVKALGGKKALLFYGGGSVVKSGLLKTVTDSLDAAGVKHIDIGGVQPNPLSELAQEAVDKHKNDGIDFVLAVGGGSVIDTAKSVAIALTMPETKVWDIICATVEAKTCLPIGAVLTIAAAGSETSNSMVLTNNALGIKRGLRTDVARPKFAIMDPVLTYTTPKQHTAAGVVDIFMHCVDRYFAPDANNDVTDSLSEALMKICIKHGRTVLDKPDDYKARAELLWAGSLAHNGLTGLGQTMDFSVHGLGAPISAKYDTSHGETLAATWAAWANHVYKQDIKRFAKYARNVWNLDISDDEVAVKAGIKETVSFFKSLDCPITISEAVGRDVSEDIDYLADLCTGGGTRAVGAFKPLNIDDVKQIYTIAMK